MLLNSSQSLNCKGKLLIIDKPISMGILNVTSNSFFDGGKYSDLDNALFQVEKMIVEGATIIDVGGCSSKPGVEEISIEDEIRNVVPIIEKISLTFPEVFISVDSYRSKVTLNAIAAGAHISNDISYGGFDDELLPMVAELRIPYVLMHMQNEPKNMQLNPKYNNVVVEVLDFMANAVDKLRSIGIIDIIIDPGFGFGKTVEHNFQLLKELEAFKLLGCIVLAGISRKSLVCKPLNVSPENALNGTTALHMVALQNGAKILRTHDVKEAMECIKLFQLLA